MTNRRLLILPIAAAAILAACVYKLTRTYEHPTGGVLPLAPAPLERPQPHEEPRDSDNKPFRFQTYLGRHRLLVVFFDADAGADRNIVLDRAVRGADEFAKADLVVVGVSTALPQHNRQALKRWEQSIKVPPPRRFLLITDLSPKYRLHRLWGRFDTEQTRPLTGTFYVDRAGRVPFDGRFPQPLADPMVLIDELLATNDAFGEVRKLHDQRHALAVRGDHRISPSSSAGDDARRLKPFEECQRPGNRRMATLTGGYTVDRYRRSAEDVAAALFRDEPEHPEASQRQRRPQPCHKRVLARFARTWTSTNRSAE